MSFHPRDLPWRPIPFVLALAYWVRPSGVPVDASAQGASAVARALAAQGMTASANDIVWLDGRGGARSRSGPLLIRAATSDNPPALYRVDARFSPEGVLLDLGTPFRLTRSSGVEELRPIVSGRFAATAVVTGDTAVSVVLVDLAGEPRPEGASWTSLMRVQNALTNVQETGALSGLGRRQFELVPPVKSLEMLFDKGALVVRGEGHEAKIALEAPRGSEGVVSGAEWLKPEPYEKGQPPGLVQWSVDRARRISWIGDRTIKVLENYAFKGLDTYQRTVKSGDDKTAAAEIAQEMGETPGAGSNGSAASATDPETGWPPPPMKPYFDKPIAGEGEWQLIANDPFVQAAPKLPPAFARAFLRTDKERPYTRVYVVMWDPRQVELHPVGGTVEPASATGTTGPGIIPRSPEVMHRVVAAFNGGFQAMHGEFGMMSDGVVYLPPKPFSATVATLRDGSTAFGVWPEDPAIPDDVLSYRQNLTPLVLNEQFNPYGRNWWGGTPPGWPDALHTTRSGLCLTKENFVAYFYGNMLDPEGMARAMIASRCKMAMHLDMNPGHTGLEFYRLAPETDWKPLDRPYEREYDTEGQVGGIDGWKFRARKMVHGMGLMHFPRYIQRESRDFMYLTLRPLLPGADLAPVVTPAEAGEGAWRVDGLPQGGFPYALATTLIRPDAAHPSVHARITAIDPRTVRVAGANDASPVVAVLQATVAPKTGAPSLWLGPGGFSIASEAIPGASALLAGSTTPTKGEGGAALGVRDEDGVLLYVEVEGSTSGAGASAAIDKLLQKLGCSTRLWVEESLKPMLGGVSSPSGAPQQKVSGREVKLVRGQAPGGRSIFENTPIVPFAQWSPLQMRRIRYFKHTND